MRPDDRVRLGHMLDAAREAVRFADGFSRTDLDRDRKLMFALLKVVEIVGEAAYQMAQESRGEIPDIPWPAVVGMRHRLVHAYFDVNLDVLWDTVTRNIPPLIEALEKALAMKR